MIASRLGLGFGLYSVRSRTGDNPFTTSGPIDVFIGFGDSNFRGAQQDNQNAPFMGDAGTLTWTGSAFERYSPNISNYDGAHPYQTAEGVSGTGTTGMNNGSYSGYWGPEAQFLKAYRAANPSQTVAFIRYGVAGALAGFYAGLSQYLTWDPANGSIFTQMTTEIGQALSALTNSGYTPTVRMIDINLGVNDAARSDTSAAFETALASIIAKIRSDWNFANGQSRILLNRPTTEQTYSAPVRAAVVKLAGAAPDLFWIDTDRFEKNLASDPNGGTIHYNAAGQISLGQTLYDSYASAENALVMTLGSDLIAWWDASYGIALTGSSVTRWADRVAELAPVQSTVANQPTYSATGFNGKPGVIFDGANDILSLSNPTGLPTGPSGVLVFGALQQDAPATDTASRTFFSYGGTASPPSSERRMRRTVVSGVNRYQQLTGTGNGLSVTVTDTVADFSGRHLVFSDIGPTTTLINVDGQADASAAAIPATADPVAQVTLGAGPAAQYWQGIINSVLLLKPSTSTEKKAAIRGFLNNQRLGA